MTQALDREEAAFQAEQRRTAIERANKILYAQQTDARRAHTRARAHALIQHAETDPSPPRMQLRLRRPRQGIEIQDATLRRAEGARASGTRNSDSRMSTLPFRTRRVTQT